MNQIPRIFNQHRVALHKARAAARFAEHDFLFREAAARLAERRKELGHETAHALDLSHHTALLDEHLPFDENCSDVVMISGGLHWVNDLPGMLIQIRRILRPGGLFLAILPGGQTLKELREAFERAEIALTGGVSPRISPFVDVRDAAALLQRAGFAEPVADSDILTVEYEHPLKLMHDLRGMGETNALIESRKHFTPRALIHATCEAYQQRFLTKEGRISATFELVTMTGWR